MKNAKKIIIIEDDKLLARMLGSRLKDAGFQVEVAFDGEEGIEFIKKEKYALIILDLIMPKVDGYEVLKTIRKEKNKAPVLILSNLSGVIDMNIAKLLGAKEFFVKANTSIEAVVGWVAKFLK